jgi:hypothetical protein
MKSEIVEQPKDTQKDKILLANNCVFSQQLFFGKNGKEALANEELSGVVSNVYAAMDEYTMQEAIKFVEYEQRFRKEESLSFRKECERIGGMFSMADYGVKNIYNDFKNRKPIKCHWDLGGRESQWEYNDKDELVHKLIENSTDAK